jgi:hypothetical protein
LGDVAAGDRLVKTLHASISIAVVLLGLGYVVDALDGWDSFAVVALIAGWAVTVTGVLHLLVALGRAGNDAVYWLAVTSGVVLMATVVAGWTLATFAREWPEVGTVSLLAVATALGIVRRFLIPEDAGR